jgi:H+/Cl- antiporter ClcA
MEETVLFVSIIKWTVLATLTGIVVGLFCTVFLKTLGWSTGFAQSYPYYYLLLPIALFVSSLLMKYLAPTEEGHSTEGTSKAIEAIHQKWGKIKIITVPVQLLATIITITGGGSAGKEGPSALLGAGTASWLAGLLRLTKEDQRKLVICGISAGFAAVFGTPIAGALFAVEVLVLGRILQEMFFPSLVSAIISVQITKTFGLSYFHHSVHLKEFSQTLFMEVLLSGLFFGLVALLLIQTIKGAEKLAKKFTIWPPFKGLIGGIIMVILSFALSSRYLGLGLNTIDTALNGNHVPTFAFFWKILFTSITLSMGGSGGIITPLFFVGTTAGNSFAHFFHLNPVIFAAIGLVSIVAAAANTPIAASVMAIEMFGSQIGSYAAIACIVSYIAAGHRSVFSSQLLGVPKSSSINVPLMKEFQSIDEVDVKEKPGKIIYICKKILGGKSKAKKLR